MFLDREVTRLISELDGGNLQTTTPRNHSRTRSLIQGSGRNRNNLETTQGDTHELKSFQESVERSFTGSLLDVKVNLEPFIPFAQFSDEGSVSLSQRLSRLPKPMRELAKAEARLSKARVNKKVPVFLFAKNSKGEEIFLSRFLSRNVVTGLTKAQKEPKPRVESGKPAEAKRRMSKLPKLSLGFKNEKWDQVEGEDEGENDVESGRGYETRDGRDVLDVEDPGDGGVKADREKEETAQGKRPNEESRANGISGTEGQGKEEGVGQVKDESIVSNGSKAPEILNIPLFELEDTLYNKAAHLVSLSPRDDFKDKNRVILSTQEFVDLRSVSKIQSAFTLCNFFQAIDNDLRVFNVRNSIIIGTDKSYVLSAYLLRICGQYFLNLDLKLSGHK